MISIISSILASCYGKRSYNLGVQGNRLTECPSSPNCVSSQAIDEGHRVAPLLFSDDPARAFARLKQMFAHRDDTTIIAGCTGYLRVEFRTTLFVDDGEFLLDSQQRVIHTRSASRLGYWDLGKNRRRMEEIRRQFANKASSANIE